MQSATEKRCTKCGELKSLDRYSFDKRRQDGRQARCRACCLVSVTEYKHRHPDKVKATHRAACRKYNRTHAAQNRARARIWERANPDKVRAQQVTSRRKHRLVLNARAAAYRKAHPEKMAARRQQEKQNYPAKRLAKAAKGAIWRAAHLEEQRARYRAYRKAHPEMALAAIARRRALKQGAQTGCRKAYASFVKWSRAAPTIPCYWCHKNTKIGERHRDHIIPLSRGGADAVENLCVACPPCNMQKSKKTPFEFTGQGEINFAA